MTRGKNGDRNGIILGGGGPVKPEGGPMQGAAVPISLCDWVSKASFMSVL